MKGNMVLRGDNQTELQISQEERLTKAYNKS